MDSFVSKHIGRLMLAVVSVAAVALFVVLGTYAYNFSGGLSLDQGKWGEFGDFLGGTLNPVLSFMALIALLLTIVLQSLELRLTREEMARSRQAQEKSEAALADQANTLREQLAETRRSADTQAFLHAVGKLQEDNVRAARGLVFRLSINEQKPFAHWNSDERKTAELVCQSFDVVGMMIKNGMVKPEPILSSWHAAIQKSWRGTKALVDERRLSAGPSFWEHYEYLHGESLKYGSPPAPEVPDRMELYASAPPRRSHRRCSRRRAA